MTEKPFQESSSNENAMNNLVWMNSKEAASYLRISTGALRAHIYKGQLPFYKLKNRLRFKRTDLDRMLENTRQGGGWRGRI